MHLAKSSILSRDSLDARRVEEARQRMQAGFEPDPRSVRPLILDSWRRSQHAGVDPCWGRSPLAAGRSGVADGGSAASHLRAAATPVLHFLRDALSDHPFLLMLTDAECRPLDLVGTGTSLREGEWINAAAGGRWTEDVVGTDAVALCRFLGEPVQVHWYEHYAAVADPWTGNAAPIRDPETSEILGTMNLYAYGCISHPQALELVTRAATMIEERLADELRARRLHLLERYEEHLGRAPAEPALCLSRRGIVLAMSPAATDRLSLGGDRAHGRAFASLPGLRLRGGAEVFSTTAPRGVEIERGDESLSADLLPVERDGEVAGFLLHLRSRGTGRRRPSAWRAAHDFSALIGESPEIRETIAAARIAAARDSTVLVVGETGTGKELIAHAIHAASPRAAGPFVPLNCGGLSPELLASELFGYAAGAFTGAVPGGRAGKLEIADGGTLFLDEVEAMTPALQVHLLRFLDDRTLVRVGGDRPRRVDVRIVAATNVDLREAVAARRFRADLYYRLSLFPVSMPPLRERSADVAAIAHHLLAEQGLEHRLDATALAWLEAQSWPGNVRELRNTLVQAALRTTRPAITADDFRFLERDGVAATTAAPGKGRTLGDLERRTILDALERHDGRLGAAAAELGLHRVTLYRKLKGYGIHRRRGYG